MKYLKYLGILLLFVISVGCEGFRSPTEPGRNGDRDGNPIPVPADEQVATVSTLEGLFSIRVTKISPTNRVIWADFRNPSQEEYLAVCWGIVDDPNEKGRGRLSAIFNGITVFDPGGSHSGMMGYRGAEYEPIPYLRGSWVYIPTQRSMVDCNRPDFMTDTPLGRWGW